MNILITGATGNVGQAILLSFLEEDFGVKIFLNPSGHQN